MKYKKLIIAGIAISLFLPTLVFAQNSSLWALISSKLKPVVATWGLQIPSLGSTGNPCVTVGTTGILATSTCLTATSTNPFMASYFVATSTATSTFAGGVDISGILRVRQGILGDMTLNATGNTTIGGTLGVTGVSTLTGAVISQNIAALTTNAESWIGPSSTTGIYFKGGYVGVGTTNPTQRLDVAGFINTDQYSGYKQAGNTVLYASSTNFSTAVGQAAPWMSATSSPFYSTAIGYQAMNATPTSGIAQYNTAVGYTAFPSNTTGSFNTAYGPSSLALNSTGNYNTATGYQSIFNNVSGSRNTANGYGSLYANTGSFNTGMGMYSLYNNTSGGNYTAIGYEAGRYQADGSTALTTTANSVYIGYGARGFNNSDDNAIVIGYNAIGLGANTAVLGNSSITKTVLNGNVGIGTSSPEGKLQIFTGTSVIGTNVGLMANGSMAFTNVASSNAIPALISRSNDSAGLFLGSGTNDANTASDMIFNVRENDNTDFATLTSTAFRFSRYGTALVDILRNGNLGIGSTSPAAKLSVTGTGLTTGKAFEITDSANSPKFTVLDSGNTSLTGTLGVTGLTTLGNASTTQISSTGSAYFATSGGNVGVGTVAPSSKLHIFDSQSGALTGGLNSSYIRSDWNPNASSDVGATALNIDLRTQGSNNFTNTSGISSGYLAFTGYGSGTVTRLNGLRIYLDAYNTTITTAYGLYLEPLGITGAGSIGTKYGIYQSGANDKNYFAGNVGIGSTSPAAKLSVTGTGLTTGKAFEITDSANSPKFTVLDSGNVGIGTTSPIGLLSILGSSATAPVVNIATSTNKSVFNIDSDGVIDRKYGIYCELYVANRATALSIPTGTTYTKSFALASTTLTETKYCDADPTNAQITITKAGKYKVSGSFSMYSGTNNVEFRAAVFVGGVEQENIHWARKITTASDMGNASFTGFITATSSSVVDYRIRHLDGGSVNLTTVYGNLNVEYIGN